MNEAIITINGQTLSEGEAMTVRVALTMFVLDLEKGGENVLGADETGHAINKGYKRCARTSLSRMTHRWQDL